MNREMNSELWTSGPREKLGGLPSAVTRRELGEFIERHEGRSADAVVLRDWLAQRERETGADAQRACLNQLMGLRQNRMQESYQTLVSEERATRLLKVNQIDAWLLVLLLEVGRDERGRHRWTAEDLKALPEAFERCVSTRQLPEEIAQRNFELGLLLDLVRKWSGDFRIWSEVIGNSVTHGGFDGRGEDWIAVWRRLNEVRNARLAEQLAVEFFHDPELVTRSRNAHSVGDTLVRDLLEDSTKALWQGQRERMLTGLREPRVGVAAWRNAFNLLGGILPEKRKSEEKEKRARALLGDQEIAQALFYAATSLVLVEKGIYRLLSATRWCEENGVGIVLPEWWASVRTKVEAMEKAAGKERDEE
jgi:hypothetical protein